MYREDLRKSWGLPEINSLETMEQYMYKAKDEYPESSVVMDSRISVSYTHLTLPTT